MNNTKSDTGIIYRIYNSGASDKLIYVLNEKGEKIKFLAKGVKKSSSRKSHSIELTNKVKIKSVEGYGVPILSEVKIISEYMQWREDFTSLGLAMMACECLDKVSYEDNPNSENYTKFTEFLEFGFKNPLVSISYLMLNLMNSHGFLPEINSSVVDQEKLSAENIYFSENIVGYVNDKDIKKLEYGRKVAPQIPKIQKFMTENSLQKTLKVTLSEEFSLELFRISLRWFENSIESKIKSAQIFLNTYK